jgi:zinc-ribbon domain
MAGFCNACGAAIGDGVRFCPACGKPSSAEIAPAATAGPMFTGSNPPPSDGAMKIVLIIVGIIGLILILMIGSCFYIGYRVKSDFTRHGKPYTGKREPCSFVSASEAADALGVPVQEATPRATSACEYVLNAEDGRMQIQYVWQGGTGAMKVMRTAMQLGDKAAFTEAPELGDEALIGPMGNPVMMRKGDVMITISLRAQGVSPEGEKKVAALIAERMGD